MFQAKATWTDALARGGRNGRPTGKCRRWESTTQATKQSLGGAPPFSSMFETPSPRESRSRGSRVEWEN
ncbi:hypothetical protein PENSUB_11792 [Penicillium subrubescens]|uniref:Uncharacterized protein n=1 Tax=Penicillium subrubescens TaxID=1316194 RepID=A0A1Q5T301_9EURO|nr:hypothetical protein PENSUB_11792 [Penicillium subrubescens]